MTGPGGDEVGRVSIRVVPDTSGFRSRLERALEAAEAGLEVTIPVNFDVDTAGLHTQLEALENSRITIPVDIGDGTEIERLRARLRALDNAQVTIPVDLDLRDEARINAVLQRLRNRTINIRARTHGVSQAIRELTQLDAVIRRLDGRQININVDLDIGAALTQLAALNGALATSAVSTRVLGQAGGRSLGGMAIQAGIAVASLALIPPLAAGIAVAGAGITAAFGAAATAMSVLPAALATVGVPLLLLMADFDELKKRVGELSPAFQQLRKDIAGALAEGLAPALQTLATGVLPQVRDGVLGIATSMGLAAQSTANWMASNEGIAFLNGLLANIDRTLKAMAPGLIDIGRGFMLLASQSAAFDVLSGAINAFGESFRANVEALIADGRMEQALRGLGETAQLAGRGFADMVHNGIALFAEAAPGVNQALESITRFFNSFDWGSLGASVGGVFEGIATAIDGIDPGTIDAIEQSFSKLADAFKDPSFAQGVQSIADSVPLAIDALTGLVQEFDEIAAGVEVALTAIRKLQQIPGIVESSATAARQAWASGLGLDTGDPLGLAALDDWVENRVRELFGMPPVEAEKGGTGTREGWERGLRGGGGTFGEPLEKELEVVPKAFEQGLAPVPGAVEQGMTPAQQAFSNALAALPPEVASQLSILASAMTTAMSGATQAISNETAQWAVAMMGGMTAMQSIATAGVTGLATTMTASFAMVTAAVTTGMAQATLAIATGTAQWVVAVMGGMTAVTTTITAQAVNWNTAIQTAMTTMQATMAAGFVQLGAGASIGLMQVEMAINTAILAWNARLQAGLIVLQTTMATGLTNLGAGASIGLMSVEMAINTAVLAWNTRLQVGMTVLQTTLTTGLALLGAAASLGLMAVEMAINTAVLAWNTRLQAAMLLLQTTMTTGWTLIAAAVSISLMAVEMAINTAILAWNTQMLTGMALLQATVTAGFAAITAAVNAGMLAIQNAFVVNWAAITAATTAAMAAIQAAVVAGMAAIVAATIAGWAQMVAAAVNGTQQMVAAVTNGANQMVAALQSAISRCVAILNAAVGQFRQAGVNMGAALAAGLESQVGRVQAAANRLAQAAAAATRAAAGIRSPSRVFIGIGGYMGEGLAIGLAGEKAAIIREAEAITDALTGIFDRASDKIDPTFGFDGDALAASVRHEMAETQVPAANAQGPGAVVNINNYVPDAERGADKALHGMRRLSRLGLFSG